MTINLENQVALVTGAGTGIGKAIALRLAEAGAKVIVNYNSSKEAAEAVVADINGKGGTATAYQCDVTDEAQVKEMIAKIGAECGGIDILINNAGSLIERCPVAEMSTELWERIINVNVKSVFLVTKYVIPLMKEKQYGRIVNVSSVAARNGGGGGAVMYATAKGAVSTFTKGLAKELCDDGILVNGIAPGVITTPFHDRFTSAEARENFRKVIPLGREGDPLEVADAALYLVSPLSSYVLGEMVEVNGGQLMD
ncbi:SDR family oxidoreductase [Alkalihalobacillus oceani]|uniref:SDR family oxidoreductase n=1 Tax=Halalkalibacter oceani TaxID=1653776 RepID=A0A9X2DP28_9BACI|nr:SDR family oxidoreductase [Halalkalibacter oceani]